MRKLAFVAGLAAAASATFSAFAGSEGAEGTDWVVTADAGETYTISTAIGNYSRLVKRGAGEVVLTAATTAFAGDVLVEEGTLSITALGALGTASPITVESGATFYLKTPHGSGQGVAIFNKHKLTIAGDGVYGKGAIRYLPSNGAAYDDSLLGVIDLTADATIECDSRWGVHGNNGGVINLNGHKLRRIYNNTSAQWMLNNCTVNGAGTLEAYKGTVTFQGAVKSSADVTYVATNTGKFYVWETSVPIPSAFTLFPGQTFEIGAGTKANNNHFSGPIHLSNHAGLPGGGTVTFSLTSPKVLHLDGPMTGDAGTNSSSGTTLTTSGSGSLFLNGDVLMRRNTYLNGGTLVAMTSTASRVFVNGFIANGNSRALIGGGNTLLNWIRVGNGPNKGTVHQTGGILGVRGDTFVGESATGVSHWMMSGGEAYVSNVVYVGSATNSYGSFRQTGGLYRGRGNCVLYIGRMGNAVYHQSGGTNDTHISGVGQSGRFLMGYQGGSSDATVSGEGTLLTTEAVSLGGPGHITTNTLNIKDGATVKATRFRKNGNAAAGTLTCVNADGATLMPTFGHGWGGWGYTDANFFKYSLGHFVIWPKGLVIDTSESSGQSNNQPSGYAASHMPFLFEAPTGKGVESVALPSTDTTSFVASNYYGLARVVFESSTGWGASAYAEYDYAAKKVTHIVVTSRGCNYGDDTKAYLESPGRGARYECALTLSDNAGKCGELVKRGAQTLYLYATNTITGGIAVESGTLSSSTAGVIPSNTPVRVESGATLLLNNFPATVSTFTGAGTVSGGNVTVTNAVRASCAELFAGKHATFSGNLTFAPGATFTITDPENLETYAKIGSRIAFTAAAVNGTPTVAFEGEPPQGFKWSLFQKDAGTYNFGAIVGTMLLIK